MNTGRLETFADGVFAIAATLLILSVDGHSRIVRACVARRSAHQLAVLVALIRRAYVVSFLTIGIIWVNHHTVMDQIDHADRTFLMITVGFPDGRRVHPVPDAARRREHQGRRREGGDRSRTASRSRLTAVLFNAIWFYARARRPAAARADADPRDGPRHLEDLRVRPVALPRPHGGRRDRSALRARSGFGVFALFWVIESSSSGETESQPFNADMVRRRTRTMRRGRTDARLRYDVTIERGAKRVFAGA